MKNLHEIMPYQLIDAVCDCKKITRDQLTGRSRKQELVVSRMLVAYMFLYMGYTLAGVGNLLGRDHSSAAHYKGIFLSGVDSLLNYELRVFANFLYKRDILLPDLDAFIERCLLRKNQ